MNGHMGVVKMLLAMEKIDLSVRNPFKHTRRSLLSDAVYWYRNDCQPEVVKLLLESKDLRFDILNAE